MAVLRNLTKLLRWCIFGKRPKLFDENFYVGTYEHARKTGIDPYLHYVLFGVRRGFDPAADFSTKFYLQQSGRTWRTPVRHYEIVGSRNGLDPHPNFNTLSYLSRYDDVQRSKINPLLHFRTNGKAEGRSAEPTAVHRQFDFLAVQPSVALVADRSQNFLVFSPPARDLAWRFERRVALQLSLVDDEIETLHRLLLLLKTAGNTVPSLQFDGKRVRPIICTAVMVFDECFYYTEDECVNIRYAEAHLWDLRPHTPRLICVDTVGSVNLVTNPDLARH